MASSEPGHGPADAMDGERTILAQGPIDQLRAARRMLAEGGLESELVAPPAGCGSA